MSIQTAVQDNDFSPPLARIAQPGELTTLRLALHANGYHPVPIVGPHIKTNSAGKRPTMGGWQNKCATANAEEITSWSRSRPDDTNTGILCGEIVGVDIDVLDEALSTRLVARAMELFGPTPLLRVGRAPKMLLVYRVAKAITKLQTPGLIFGHDHLTKIDTKHAKVEIMADGQQFVAFGIHPDTGAYYHWPETSLLDFPASDVPLVTLELLKQFVAEAEQTLRATGGRTKAEIMAAIPQAPSNAEALAEIAISMMKTAAADVASEQVAADDEFGAVVAAASAQPAEPDFFKTVNALAMVRLGQWVPALFEGKAKPQASGGYRVTSRDLGRDRQEDLSISPLGIVDFGVADQGDARAGKRTPIDLVIEYQPPTKFGGPVSATDAALLLCEHMSIAPEALGWGQTAGTSATENVIKLVASQTPIHATPYVWTDPASIPERQWVYGKLLLREFVTATISPGGIGKSSLIAAEALAMVSGKGLLGVISNECLRVWVWNLEDPLVETQRKIQAAALHYRLVPDDIGDRLMVDSGRDQKLVIATTTRTGAVIVQPVVDSLVAEILKYKIDVLVIDPFVSCHEVSENDNMAMDMVVKEWGRVAGRGNCAVHLVHHTRKPLGAETEVTTNSSRGAVSQTDACRVVRPLNRMTEKEATAAGVDNHRLYFRTLQDKDNLSPPVEKSDWFRLVSVDLHNGPMGLPGDSVGVVTKWIMPDALAGMTGADFDKVARVIRGGKWREHAQASAWVGKAVAEALEIDIDNKTVVAKVKRMLAVWYAAKTLVVVERDDDNRNPRKFVEVAEEV